MLGPARVSFDSPPPSPRRLLDTPTAAAELLPADYDKLLILMRRANLIRDGPRNVHRNSSSFKGEDLVAWLMRERGLSKLMDIRPFKCISTVCSPKSRSRSCAVACRAAL